MQDAGDIQKFCPEKRNSAHQSIQTEHYSLLPHFAATRQPASARF